MPPLFCGPVSEGSEPKSSVADVPVRGQFSALLVGATVGSHASTDPTAGTSLPVKKSSRAVTGKN